MNVFISYSSKEKEEAAEIQEMLLRNGFSVWIAPDSIPMGANYMSEIPMAIEACDVFLLLLSPNAQNSMWVLKELGQAVTARKPVLPYMLKECSLNREFLFCLEGCQFICAYENRIEALKKLAARIRGIAHFEGKTAESAQPMFITKESNPKVSIMERKEENSLSLTLPDGSSYEGEVENGVPHGKGMMITVGGLVLEGIFRDGKYVGEEEKRTETSDSDSVHEKQETAEEVVSSALVLETPEEKTDDVPQKRVVPPAPVTSMLKEMVIPPAPVFQTPEKKADEEPEKRTDEVPQNEEEIRYANGDRYVGEVQNGKPHGTGVMLFANKERYEGTFVRGKRDGYGEFYYGGCVYKGSFRKGRRHGEGVLILKDGTKYEGTFRNATSIEGICKKTTSDGKVRFGTYINGEFHPSKEENTEAVKEDVPEKTTQESSSEPVVENGTGKLPLKNKAVYEGEIRNGKAEGKGKITYKNGDVYVGQVKDGKPDGKGRLDLKDAGFISGSFVGGVANGIATRQFKNGRIYKGEFKNGAATGKGKVVYKNGDVYEGEVINATPNGKGVMKYKKAQYSYKGEFKSGVPHGFGIYTWQSGAKYEGDSQNGKRQGKGVYTWPDGERYVGEFYDGKRHGRGTYYFADGTKYEGTLKEGQFDGKVHIVPVNGKPFQAIFENGTMVSRL